MSDEEPNDSDELSLSWGPLMTLPISLLVLWILSLVESEREYFDVEVPKGGNPKRRRDMLRYYFHAAFYDRSRLYIPLFLVVIWALVFDPFKIPLQSYGLALDAFGAIIIAAGLFRGVKGLQADIPAEYKGGATYGKTHLVYRPAPISSTVRSTIDGVFGTTYLFTGFTIQIVAVSGLL